MAEEEPKSQAGDQDELPEIRVPSHAPLPPPPDVKFTRPTLGRATPSTHRASSPRSGQEEGDGSGDDSGVGRLGAGLAASLSFGASIFVGFAIGQWIDHRWNHSGMLWGTLIMTLVGAAAGFINIFRLTSATGQKRKKK